MRVCFYWFNLGAPPGMSAGVALLARELVDAGHTVRVVHLNERVGLSGDPAEVLAQPDVAAAELHALSFGLNHADAALDLAGRLKAAFPKSHVLCGGVHTTLNGDAVLAHPGVDSVCVGEADGLLRRFTDGLTDDEPAPVPGFWTRRHGRVERPPLGPLPDLSAPSLPYFDGIDYRAIIEANRGFVETLVGRGCLMACNYCHNAAMQKTVRAHSAEAVRRQDFCRQRPLDHVLAELQEHKARYGDRIKAVVFGDDTIAGDRDWLTAFSRRYTSEVGLPFICNAIAGQVDDEVAGLFADAGCNMVKFGVESGSERVRREVLNRHLSEQRLADAVAALHRRGVNTRAYVMLGAPGETDAERRATVQLCARLRFDSVRPAILYPYPGTELHRRCLAEGLIDPARRPPDYSSTTVLNLPEAERRRIEQDAALYAWLLNAELGGEAAAAARPLVEAVRSTPPADWSVARGRQRIAAEAAPLHAELRARGVDHYHSPFADRPDVIFLYRARARPLINVEEEGE